MPTQLLLVALPATVFGLNIGSAYENTFLTLFPTYSIVKPDAMTPIIESLVATAKKEDGFIYCGYSSTRSLRSTSTVGGYAAQPGDKIFGRLAFPDAEALSAHLKSASYPSAFGEVATLESLSVHGPASELAKLDSLSVEATLYETESGLSRLERETGAAMLPIQAISVHTEFKLVDAAGAKPLCDKLVERTVSETDCLYCGWTRCGDTLFLREARAPCPFWPPPCLSLSHARPDSIRAGLRLRGGHRTAR